MLGMGGGDGDCDGTINILGLDLGFKMKSDLGLENQVQDFTPQSLCSVADSCFMLKITF